MGLDLEDLDDGDILLCSGVSRLEQSIQRYLLSAWSRVAILLRPSPASPLHVFVSTQLPICTDVGSGRTTNGVQTNLLDDFVRAIQGKLVARRLLVPDLERARVRTRLLAFRTEIGARPFKRSIAQMRRAKHRRNRASDLSSIYCGTCQRM